VLGRATPVIVGLVDDAGQCGSSHSGAAYLYLPSIVATITAQFTSFNVPQYRMTLVRAPSVAHCLNAPGQVNTA
jgi:hypothetical protein